MLVCGLAICLRAARFQYHPDLALLGYIQLGFRIRVVALNPSHCKALVIRKTKLVRFILRTFKAARFARAFEPTFSLSSRCLLGLLPLLSKGRRVYPQDSHLCASRSSSMTEARELREGKTMRQPRGLWHTRSKTRPLLTRPSHTSS